MTGDHSLFGQQGAGFQQVAAQQRVLTGDLWWPRTALQVQTADKHIEDSRHGSQFHTIKYGGQLWTQRVHVSVLKH